MDEGGYINKMTNSNFKLNLYLCSILYIDRELLLYSFFLIKNIKMKDGFLKPTQTSEPIIVSAQ